MNARVMAALEGVLRAAALGSVLFAALWILGPNGTSTMTIANVPSATDSTLMSSSLGDWAGPPTVAAEADSQADFQALYQGIGTGESTGSHSVTVPRNRSSAEVLLPTVVEISEPPLAPRLTLVGINVAASLAIAVVFWLLAGLVRSGRGNSPFTAKNARRLTSIAVIVGGGGVALSLARWGLGAWLINTSTLADRIGPETYRFTDLPWGALAVGGSVFVLAQVWRHGVSIAHDLEGLV